MGGTPPSILSHILVIASLILVIITCRTINIVRHWWGKWLNRAVLYDRYVVAQSTCTHKSFFVVVAPCWYIRPRTHYCYVHTHAHAMHYHYTALLHAYTYTHAHTSLLSLFPCICVSHRQTGGRGKGLWRAYMYDIDT